MSESTYLKPLPVPSPESQPFWDACRRHELRLPRCSACSAYWFPPSGVCPECLSDQFEWALASGRGEVFSFVVMHRVYHKGFADDVPYVLAIIEFDEGWRMDSNVINIDPKDVTVGMPVEVVWEDATPEFTLPKFQPAR